MIGLIPGIFSLSGWICWLFFAAAFAYIAIRLVKFLVKKAKE